MALQGFLPLRSTARYQNVSQPQSCMVLVALFGKGQKYLGVLKVVRDS